MRIALQYHTQITLLIWLGIPCYSLLIFSCIYLSIQSGQQPVFGFMFDLALILALLPALALAIALKRNQRHLLALHEQQQHFRDLYNKTPVMLHSLDLNGKLISVNDAWLARTGYQRNEVLGRPLLDFLSDASRRHVMTHVLPRFLARGEVHDVYYQLRGKRGDMIDTRLSAIWERDTQQQPVRTLAVLTDITEERRLDRALAMEKRLITATLHAIKDGVLRTNQAGHVTYLNETAEQLCGWSHAAAYGKNFSDVMQLFTDPQQANPLGEEEGVRLGSINRLPEQVMLKRQDGTQLYLSNSVSSIMDEEQYLHGYVMVFQDISQSRSEKLMTAYLANHDVLTGLANRALFMQQLQQCCDVMARKCEKFAIMFVDLDRFKPVNDQLGHQAGDQLLRQVSQRLSHCLRKTDMVGRLGGDEFILLLQYIRQPADVIHIAEKIRYEIARPYHMQERDIHIGCSLGIAVFPDDASTAEQLVQHADLAMYAAKQQGRDRYCFYQQLAH